MIDYKYMASWYETDPDATIEIPKTPIWIFWDGSDSNNPPKRVKILLTGLIYKWEEFQKIRIKKFQT